MPTKIEVRAPVPYHALNWHEQSEWHVPKFEFDTRFEAESEAERAFRQWWLAPIEAARKSGQFSVKVRLIVEFEASADDPYERALLRAMAAFLKQYDAVLEYGAVLGRMTDTGHIYFIPITITW